MTAPLASQPCADGDHAACLGLAVVDNETALCRCPCHDQIEEAVA